MIFFWKDRSEFTAGRTNGEKRELALFISVFACFCYREIPSEWIYEIEGVLGARKIAGSSQTFAWSPLIQRLFPTFPRSISSASISTIHERCFSQRRYASCGIVSRSILLFAPLRITSFVRGKVSRGWMQYQFALDRGWDASYSETAIPSRPRWFSRGCFRWKLKSEAERRITRICPPAVEKGTKPWIRKQHKSQKLTSWHCASYWHSVKSITANDNEKSHNSKS